MIVRQLQPKFVPKVWGSMDLGPWFPKPSEKIGEVWFPAGNLLIKFLFTTEALSVQVHPDDDYAGRCENSLGKTEMWHILRAQPEAQIALGFKRKLDPSELRDLCASGEVIHQLNWRGVRPGNTFFIPPGTVHAIGSGLVLCEVQQNSDITYRMFDYGRPRELHLERAMDVATLGQFADSADPNPDDSTVVSCEYFVTSIRKLVAPEQIDSHRFAVMLHGTGTVGGQPFQAGTVWETGAAAVEISPAEETEILLTGKPVTTA